MKMLRGLRKQDQAPARPRPRIMAQATSYNLRHVARRYDASPGGGTIAARPSGAALVTACGAALLVAMGCGGSSAKAPPSAPSPLLTRATPDFARAALDGSRVETSSLRGRVMLVDF